MNHVVPISLARKSALTFLYKVELRAIIHLCDSLALGTFDGRKYTSCFFGKLAEGSGYSFSNSAQPERTLGQFLKYLGLQRIAGEYEPIELFSAWIVQGSTVKNDPRAQILSGWCTAVLSHRGNTANSFIFDRVEGELVTI